MPIELPAAGDSRAIELTRADFAAAAEALYDDVLRVLQRARPAGAPLHVRVSHRWMSLPGFADRLAGLRDSDVLPLPRGAAALRWRSGASWAVTRPNCRWCSACRCPC